MSEVFFLCVQNSAEHKTQQIHVTLALRIASIIIPLKVMDYCNMTACPLTV